MGPGALGQEPVAPESLTVAPWNDLAALAATLGDDVAAVIMSPSRSTAAVSSPSLATSRGPAPDTSAGAVLIFDEVITGYRVALGGAQERLGVLPDLGRWARRSPPASRSARSAVARP